MSFGGSVSAMITSLKNNARARKSLFDKTDYFRMNNSSNLKNKPTKKASAKQLKKVRKQMAEENKKLIVKRILALIISGLILMLLLNLVFDFL